MKIDTSVQAKWNDPDATIEFELRMSARLDLGVTISAEDGARTRLDNEIGMLEIRANVARFASSVQSVQSAIARALDLIETRQTSGSPVDADWSAAFNFTEEPSLLFNDGFVLYTCPTATLQWCSDGALSENEAALAMARQVAKAIVAVASLCGEVSFYDDTHLNLG